VGYSVVFDKKAAKNLEKLSANVKTRIFQKIVDAKEDPFRYFEKLTGRTDYKLRVGEYRVIADINREVQRIEVTVIGHRKNIYRKG
jgi:mRNA interferase RelE/StbE